MQSMHAQQWQIHVPVSAVAAGSRLDEAPDRLLPDGRVVGQRQAMLPQRCCQFRNPAPGLLPARLRFGNRFYTPIDECRGNHLS